MKSLTLAALLFASVAQADARDIDFKIIETCRVVTCSSMTVADVNAEQARCQSYFKTCMAQGKMQFDEKYNYDVCVAARPAQLLVDKVNAQVGEINARRKVDSIRGPRNDNQKSVVAE